MLQAFLLLPLVAASLAAAAGTPAAKSATASTWQQVRERGVLRVGLPGDYAPYALVDADGARGLDVALVREIAATHGLDVEFVPTSWSALLADAEAGRFDLAAGGISITAERQRQQGFTRDYLSDHKAPLVRCGEEARFDTTEEINRPTVRLVVNPGGTNERFTRSQFPAASLVVHPENRTVAEELQSGRADVFVTDAIEGELLASTHAGLCVVAAAPDWLPAFKGLMVVAGDGAREQIDAALASALARRPAQSRLSDWQAHDWRNDPREQAARDLARLADMRLDVVTEVARWKWNRQAPIEDLQREASLLAAQRAAGERLGVPAARIDGFFGAQIASAKQLQRDLFDLWRREGAGQFEGVVDLDSHLRPAIDAINARMVEALARWDGRTVTARRLGPYGTGQLSPEASELALGPLVRGEGTPAGKSGR